ncbi:hypothetical protein AVEN_99878-1 [Araneus ventricosus]|uniref:Uncharacterized protein n=1 Tax=Araneus ventricosus TaxID=182803 RepID=A0A4Y2J8S9_ARAVE|nr:hypothetical protein AVEN_99878-1 [Araneus ventricosus]
MLPVGGTARCSRITVSEKKAISNPLQVIVAIALQAIENVHFSQHRDGTHIELKISVTLCSVSKEMVTLNAVVQSQNNQCRHSQHWGQELCCFKDVFTIFPCLFLVEKISAETAFLCVPVPVHP